MKKQNLIAIASLAMLLAGCGGNSDTTKPSASTAPASTSTAPTSTTPTSTTPSTKPSSTTSSLPTEITDDDFGYLATEDLTFTATNKVSISGVTGSISKKSTIKLGDGLYKEEGKTTVSGSSTSTSDVESAFWKGDDGYAHYYDDPDFNNIVTENVLRADYDSNLVNPFDATEAFEAIFAEDFTYNSRKSKKNTYSTFVLSNDKLNDEDIAAFLLFVDNFANFNASGLSNMYFTYNYKFNGDYTTPTASDITINHVYLYANNDGLLGIDYSISADLEIQSSKLTFTSEQTLLATDVDNTGLTKADVTKVPYTKTAGADTQYTAFDTAIAGMKAAKNYTLSGYIAEGKTKLSGFDLAFVNDEYSSKTYDYTSLGQVDADTVSYSGVHKVSDGVYDIYSSDTVAIASGANHTTAATMPTLDLSSAIFEYDATNSTADDYVFTLRSAYSSSEAFQLFSNLLYINVDGTLSVTVSKAGVLKSVSTTYSSTSSVNTSLTSTYTAVFNFSDIGATTAIPSTLATFTDYVAYKTPKSYAEITSTIYDYDNKQYLTNTNLEDVLKTFLGETVYANLPDIFSLYDLGDAYSHTLYSAKNYKLVEIGFYYADYTSVQTAFTGISHALTNAGLTVQQNAYGGYVFTFTGGTISLNSTTEDDGGYLIYLDIQANNSTSTTSL